MTELTKGKKIFLVTAALLAATYIVMVYVLGLRLGHVVLVYLIYLALAYVIYRPSFVAFAGNFRLVSGKTEKARKLLEKAISLNTTVPSAYLNYAIILLREGSAEEAMSYLLKAKELDPKTVLDKNISLTMGSCFYIMGRIDDAIETLERIRRDYVYAGPHVLSTLGYMYFLKDDLDTALELTNSAIEDSPRLGSAWDNLGQIHYKKSEFDEAKKAFEKAIECKNDLVDSHYYLGLIAEAEGNTQNARVFFEKAKNCKITSLNTVTAQEVDDKYRQYFPEV